MGFGLAGGGYGAYSYCPVCGRILHKTQEHDETKEKTMGMKIGDAIVMMEANQKVRRAGWHGKGMWLELQVPGLGSKMNLPYVYINIPKPDGTYSLVPWLCSQTDLLAHDWELAT
jgi:hypothetical protein